MSKFSVFPFIVECVVCGKEKSIYDNYGFVENKENVRERECLCSPACYRVKARELGCSEGVNEYHLY